MERGYRRLFVLVRFQLRLWCADALEKLGHPRGKLSGKADVLKQLHELCMNIMHQVKLGYLIEREGGWGTAKHWSTTLSLGEQQRMGMGRLFYHRCALCAYLHQHSGTLRGLCGPCSPLAGCGQCL